MKGLGEIFSAADSFRDGLRERTEAGAIDVNLFGLAEACAANDVPMVALRVVSDRAGAEFGRFSRDHDGEGGRLAAGVVRGLAKNPERPGSYEGLRSERVRVRFPRRERWHNGCRDQGVTRIRRDGAVEHRGLLEI